MQRISSLVGLASSRQSMMPAVFQMTREMSRVTRSGRYVLTKTPGYGVNYHRSNRAKEGLYHGKDVQFGNSISHSVKHTKRRWNPNVQNKRVWSDGLEGWVRFKMTTKAIRAVDDAGGIDNYLLQLDDRLVADSNYITKMRTLIANALYHKGELSEKHTIRMKYHKWGPAKLDISFDQRSEKWLANGSPYVAEEISALD